MQLSPSQENAMNVFMDFMVNDDQHEMIITGFAGTGKSALTKYILENVEKYFQLISLLKNADKNNLPIHVTATTNKAARVIADMAGTEPQTIHSLLGLKLTTDFKTGKQNLKKTSAEIIRNSFIIIDEASFVNPQLLEMIRKHTHMCKILYIGDSFQLAPVKENECPVFSADSLIPLRADLIEPQRNSGLIEQTAGAYRDALKTGKFPVIKPDGVSVIQCDGASFQQEIEDSFKAIDVEPYRILAWSNARVHQYNQHVNALRGHTEFLYEDARVITNKPIMLMGTNIATDSHCTVTKIEEETEREAGQTGMVLIGNMVTLDNRLRLWVPKDQDQVKRALRVLAKQKSWAAYYEIKERWGDLRPTYASTVHKSQGSSYDDVFIDIADICRCNIASDVARLLYVAFSRARNRVFVYGDIPAKYGSILV